MGGSRVKILTEGYRNLFPVWIYLSVWQWRRLFVHLLPLIGTFRQAPFPRCRFLRFPSTDVMASESEEGENAYRVLGSAFDFLNQRLEFLGRFGVVPGLSAALIRVRY